MFEMISRDVQEDFGECSRRFSGMLLKIWGNVINYFGERSKGFQLMFEKIPGNVPEDSKEYWGMFEQFLNFGESKF